MGIPYLTAQIRPYTQSFSWTCKADESRAHRGDLIIDGPSFAYYIYNCLVLSRPRPCSTLAAFPTYFDLAEAAIAWLEEIETFGVLVKHIFFDGYLPKSKTDTRYDRLSKHLLQVNAFRSATARHATGNTSALPPAPFLVSAVSDALYASRFGALVRTVASEAETQCTSSMILEDDIVLTNDSDLIVLAVRGKVMFFNDLVIRHLSPSEKTLDGMYCDACYLRKVLDCNDLVKLGFVLTRNPHSTLKELAKRMRHDDYDCTFAEAAYLRFEQGYLPEYQHSTFAWATEGSTALAPILQRLDARVSELVHDWGAHLENIDYPVRGCSSNFTSKRSHSRHMFLIPLIDDPARSSAWKPSVTVRALAYSILSLCGPKFRMMEVDRRGDRILGINISLLLHPAVVLNACNELLETHPQRKGSSGPKWRLFSVLQVMSWMRQEGFSLPSKSTLRSFCLSQEAVSDWDMVHLSAQVQGHLYSLRILRQVLEVYLTAGFVGADIDRAILYDLMRMLSSMPSIPELMPQPACGLAMDASSLTDLDEALLRLYPEQEQAHKDKFDYTKREAKRHRQTRTMDQTGKTTHKGGAALTSNMYSVLEDM